MSQQINNSVEKQTPFLKRVSNIEKDIAELKKQIELLKKVLKR